MEFLDFAQRNWVLFALAFGLFAALLYTELNGRLSGVKALNPTQLTRLINGDEALLIDLRDDGAFRDGHIPSARHVPLAELERRAAEFQAFNDRPAVVYCAHGSANAGKAAKILKKSGFTTVHTLTGGIAAWRDANLPLQKHGKKKAAQKSKKRKDAADTV